VRLLDHEPNFFRNHAVLVELKLDEDVTGVKLAIRFLADTLLHRAHTLGRDEDAPDDVLNGLDLDFALKRILHAVFFVARDSQDEELHGLCSLLFVRCWLLDQTSTNHSPLTTNDSSKWRLLQYIQEIEQVPKQDVDEEQNRRNQQDK